jgi:hypothetical protein
MSVWKSEVTTQMVKDLTIDEIALLVADLDDAVQAVCQDWGVEG